MSPVPEPGTWRVRREQPRASGEQWTQERTRNHFPEGKKKPATTRKSLREADGARFELASGFNPTTRFPAFVGVLGTACYSS